MRRILFLTTSLIALTLLYSSIDVHGCAPQGDRKTKSELRKERKLAREQALSVTADSLLTLGDFKFVAQRMVSTIAPGRSSLNGTYGVTIQGETINSYLPFFGKMNSAQMGRVSGPMDFRATLLNYKKSGAVTVGGTALVTMNGKPEGSTNYYTLTFEVYGAGEASLNILQHNGDSALFYGYITAIEER